MLAIVDLNGKQYQVEEGRYLNVDRLQLDENATFEIQNVLMVVDGEDSLVGAPYVEGAVVKAKVLRHARGPKLLVYKMRCKKGYRRKNGHRQDFTQVQIEGVEFPGRKAKPAATVEAPAKEAKKPATKKAAETKTAETTKKAEKKPAAEKKATAKASTATKTEKPKAAAAKKPPAEAQPKAAAEQAPEQKPEQAPENNA